MWQLALPIMAGLVGQTLIGIADTVMVGAVGVEALAAASLVVNLFHLPLVFGFGMLSSRIAVTFASTLDRHSTHHVRQRICLRHERGSCQGPCTRGCI